MRIRQLKYFLRVCELGSITRAASELHIAQPALGLHVRSLEETFGVSLLERRPRGVTPTQAGKLIMDWAREVIDREQAIKRAVQELAGTEQIGLSLGLTPSLTYMLTSQIIKAMSARFPACVIKITEGISQYLAEWVEGGRIDLALSFSKPSSDAIIAIPVMEERLFYLSKAGDGYDPISLAQVLAMPLAVADEPNSIRQEVEAAARTIGLQVNVKHEISSQHVAKEIARSGVAGSITPYGGTSREQQAGELSVRLIVDPMIERTLYLMRPSKTPASKVEAGLISVLYEELAAMAASCANSGAYRMLARSDMQDLSDL